MYFKCLVWSRGGGGRIGDVGRVSFVWWNNLKAVCDGVRKGVGNWVDNNISRGGRGWVFDAILVGYVG